VIEETLLGSRPSEIIKVGKQTFTLINYTFTRTNIIDKKPAINYYSGNTWGKKTYRTGNTLSGNTITVDSTGSFYGYDQYWV
jgi:N-acetylmuramoyl-L-alanine amidase